MFVIDTNILVYAANVDSHLHRQCRDFVEEARRQHICYLTWGICFEFLRVATHRRVLRSPWSAGQAWSFLDALLKSESVGILSPGTRHAEIVAALVKAVPTLVGNEMHDAEIVALMHEHGVKQIYTRDRDFHRFPAIEPVDPTSG